MQSNPIMERVVRLSEQWKSTLTDYPDLRVICWRGSSLTEYKLIKGLIMFQMSYESTLDDLFILCGQPFHKENATRYGYLTGDSINQYVDIWNNDAERITQNDKIDWKFKPDLDPDDVLNYVLNINALADCLLPETDSALFVVALFPSEIRDFEIYRNWMESLLRAPISKKVRYMLYERVDATLLKKLVKVNPLKFKYLIPDIDMGSAIHEVLENAKQERTDSDDKDAITFQQHLIYLTEAIGKGEDKVVDKSANAALAIAEKHQWLHLKAIVYYFLHSLFIPRKEYKKAEEYINLAIAHMQKAVSLSGEEHLMSYCEYITSKAMLFLIQENFNRAVAVYDDALNVASQLNNPVLKIGIYQMKAICQRLSGNQDDAWDTFMCGWELIEGEGEEFIQSQSQYKCYASEMLKVKHDNGSKRKYECRFRELWGIEWLQKMEHELKQSKREYKIFDV